MFYFEEINGLKILKSDLLTEANHFFTTKIGDEILNTQGWNGVLSSDLKIITPTQTHSDNIEFTDERSQYPDTDGLILNKKDIAIYLKFADCTPLIFYDTKQKIGAVVHAGWKGTVQKIGVKALKKMNSNPNDIKAIIGPAIGGCCYETSEEIKNKLLSTINNHADVYCENYVDLKQINKQQLREFGVKEIDICPYCTSCNNDLFYSYRKENQTVKRHYAVLDFNNS